ncbi:hypothetical protein [Streptomyces sp. NBC_00233]|uniref:hypothetical protein n=1 Tax=Streptomyces sp. NBC_00233 TaxID=2975686 RepID=UPI002259B5CF|nr:hypothetical protein [Streptomyces sp. NBC_00233]MCX5229652.1 hypothetical protein [Streptomyces sp. NBC_00233]
MPRDETQYAEQAGDNPARTVETDLGAAILEAATALEQHAENAAERDATAALAIRSAYEPEAIAEMTGRLLTRVEGLAVGVERIPVCRRGASGVGALATWERLKAQGPASDPLDSWTYMRTLAHATHGMVHSLREHRAAEQPRVFVGRPGLPPLTPTAP